MDNNWLLVKCITLLYRESLIEDKTENSSDLVRNILDSIKLPETSLSMNHDREKYMGLKEIALYMCNQKIDYVYEKNDLLQTLKLKCGDDDKLYNIFLEGIEKDMDEGSLKRTILQIKKGINDYFRENQAIEIVNKASIDLKFNRVKIKNVREYIKEFMTLLEPYQIESNRKDPAIVSSVDLGDESGLNDVFNNIKNDDEGTSLFVTGWQDLNQMLQGGFRRGESWIVPALQHKYKTGFTLTLFKQIAIYNTPILINPNKKPLLLRISFEDELENNLRFLYQNLWENEHNGESPDLKSVSGSQMATYVKEKLQVNGFHIKMMRVNPSDWSYKDIQNTVLEFEANGYEVQLVMIDYLYKIPPTGCTQGPMGHDIMDLFDRMRQFFAARKITFITPHQFSTEAKQLVRDGHSDFVKKICELGYFEGSKKLDQVVDGEIYIHIEKKDGQSYLTIQRGKHRITNIIPESHKYFVLPFPKKGTILDDLNKPIISLSKVGGGPKGSPTEIPFYEFDDRNL